MTSVSEKVIPLHLKAGRFGEEFREDIDYSVRHYKAILRLRPTHEESSERLIELYRVEQRWHDLCEIYQHRLRNIQGQEETLALLYDKRQSIILISTCLAALLPVIAKCWLAIRGILKQC